MQIEEISKIKDHNDLAEFIQKIRQELIDNPAGWQNADLPAFLEAMSAWVEDFEGYCLNTGEPMPTAEAWQVVAKILCASRIYE